MTWTEILTPARAGLEIDLGDDAVQIHHRLRWDEPVPPDYELTAVESWASGHRDRVDLAITVQAQVEGRSVAAAELINRTSKAVEPFGDGTTPRRPDLAGGEVRSTLRFEASDVKAFADQVRFWPALHLDEDYCRQAGFSGLVVQGLLQLSRFVDDQHRGDHGDVEIWFRHPVCAGDQLELLEHDGGVWSSRLAATGVTAAIIAVRR